MKAQCPDCSRWIGVTKVGTLYAHGSHLGLEVETRRCPGSGRMPLPPLPEYDLKDRVVRLGDQQSGVVVGLRPGEALVHWGTASMPGQREQRFEDWIPAAELKLLDEPVFVHGERGTKETVTVWDPKER